ncbi:hypothetical protein SeMB42_g00442 [Synchytrium endobioticum]|nr:hypothetical protein SeMB42_g00442 [Synchytrium endobioticum]
MALFCTLVIGCRGDARSDIDRAYLEAEKEIKHVSAGDFAKGLWLVFLGAKWCNHCKVLTPKWLQLQDKVADMEARDIFVRKLECTSRDNEDFCANKMKLTSYPTIRLFFNGNHTEDYNGANDVDDLYKFLLDRANQFIPRQESTVQQQEPPAENVKVVPSVLFDDKRIEAIGTPASKNVTKGVIDGSMDRQVDDEIRGIQSLISAVAPLSANVNPDGKIAHLTGSHFSEALESGPLFVMFHAPWCGHCKKLAPVWEDFAGKMKNKLIVATVDCTAESVLCKQKGVRGYPTLSYFAESEATDFFGKKTVEGLQEFAEKAASAQAVFPIKHTEVSPLLQKSDVAFFFVYDVNNPPRNGPELISAINVLRGNIKIYVCPDTRALTILGIPNEKSDEPTLMVSKDRGSYVEVFSQPFTKDAVLAWIKSRKTPLVQELDGQSAGQILSSGNLIVLGCLLNPEVDEESKSHLKTMRDMAKAWNRFITEKKKAPSKQVVYVWIDGSRRVLGEWLSSSYSLSQKELPRLLIVDTKEETYYDTDANGKLLMFDSEATTATVYEILRGQRQGKSPSGLVGRMIKSIVRIGLLIQGHPLLMTILAIGLVVIVIYLAVGTDDTTPSYNQKPE